MVEDGGEEEDRHEHLVWEKEQKGEAGDENAGDKEGGVAGATEDAEAGNFWDPYQDPPTPSLKTYLRALPSGQHYGKGSCIVATDGSFWRSHCSLYPHH